MTVKRNQEATINVCKTANMASQYITNHKMHHPCEIVFREENAVDDNTALSAIASAAAKKQI